MPRNSLIGLPNLRCRSPLKLLHTFSNGTVKATWQQLVDVTTRGNLPLESDQAMRDFQKGFHQSQIHKNGRTRLGVSTRDASTSQNRVKQSRLMIEIESNEASDFIKLQLRIQTEMTLSDHCNELSSICNHNTTHDNAKPKTQAANSPVTLRRFRL